MINPDDIIYFVLDLWEVGEKDDSIVIEKIQEKFGLTRDQAELVPELTRTGLFRASIISSGTTYPISQTDKNPITTSATKIGLIKLGRADLVTMQKKQSRHWWKFW